MFQAYNMIDSHLDGSAVGKVGALDVETLGVVAVGVDLAAIAGGRGCARGRATISISIRLMLA